MFAPKFMALRMAAVALVAIGFAGAASAQLVISEIMYNPSDSGDLDWEYIEVVNTGPTPIDFAGDGWVADIGNTYRTTFNPNITTSPVGTTGITIGTSIPGNNGIAVLYDGFRTGFDEVEFRAAWDLDPSVQLIPMQFKFAPWLSNSGEGIGIWPSRSAIEMDSNETESGNLNPFDPNVNTNGTVARTDNALVFVEYNTDMTWPTDSNDANGFSIELNNLTDDASQGANWTLSAMGARGASTSVPVLNEGEAFKNSADDFGSPGSVQMVGTPPADRLIISEIMYNPASNDADWEWVELYNNTGEAIDFGANPAVFDDNDNDDLAGANITSGMIPDGGVAVLYDAGNDPMDDRLADMQAAWDPNGNAGQGGGAVNFIPVTDWTALTNSGGDGIAVWSSFADYTSETQTGQDRTFDNALTSVVYENGNNGWVADNGDASIYLTDLTNVDATELPVGDFNENGVVDAADYTIWRDNLGTLTGALPTDGDADGDGDVDEDDYTIWSDNYGNENTNGPFWALSGSDPFDLFDSRPAVPIADPNASFHDGGDVGTPGVFVALGPATAVPEPSTALLLLAGVAGLASARRNG